ncbi:MAG TPA: hypothetical protein VE970_13455 [Pseudolabrys sp.]|nr:hypothetical protein [Pseudolabrys sp.]
MRTASRHFSRAQHDLLVAALDKDVCQFVGQGLAARDREQVLLLFGPRALDQRPDIERPWALGKPFWLATVWQFAIG